MNIDPRAAQVHLGLSHVFRGVDAIIQQLPGAEMLLDGSSDSSSYASGASSAISPSQDDTSSSPSLTQGDDNSSVSSIWSGSSRDSMDSLFEELTSPQFSANTNQSIHHVHDNYDMFYDDEHFGVDYQMRDRCANRWEYIFGDYLDSNYVRKFLCDDIRDITYEKSRDRNSVFRSHFRVPLSFIDTLTEMFISRGWVKCTKRCHNEYMLSMRTQLFIMCALEHLGNRRPHRQFETETNMCFSEHQQFFNTFLDRMYARRFDHVAFPSTLEGLQSLSCQYHRQHLPGACGSIDVIHVKWSNCPSGDFNKCKGKESFPSVAFEVVTDNRRRVLGISPIQYGARSDKHIVRLDPTVTSIRDNFYKYVEWEYYTINGEVKRDKGVYLICDGGYLRWVTLMCPYAGSVEAGRRGYFNTNLESIRKDVECTFGILKKRWRILDYGLQYRNMHKCEKLFWVCCILHNMLLELPEDDGFSRVIIRAGRGGPLGNDGLWIEGPVQLRRRLMGETALSTICANDKREGLEWKRRRDCLAAHLEYCKSIGH
jgi:hypothetical protein